MKDKDDILVKIFRNRLKDYERPVRNDLWESIEKELNPVKKISPVRRWIAWSAAAASILLVLGLGMFLYRDVKVIENRPVQASGEQTKPGTNITPQPGLESSSSEWIAETRIPEVRVRKNIYKVSEKDNRQDDTKGMQVKNPAIKEEKTTVLPETDNFPAVRNSEPGNSGTPENSSFYEDANNGDRIFRDELQGDKKSNQGFSIALALGNSGYGNESSSGRYGMNSSNQFLSDYAVVAGGPKSIRSNLNFHDATFAYNPVANKTAQNIDYQYDLPVSVGFLIRKDLSGRFALESGIVYTYLASREVVSNYQYPETSYDIRLNYLGIPLKGVYTLLKNNRWSLYVTAGGMVEKSVYGQVKTTANGNQGTEKLDVKELQWSLSGTVGVNYRLYKNLGIFFEPGAGYYFDDGSEIRTIRKDQPFNVTLQGGLRLMY